MRAPRFFAAGIFLALTVNAQSEPMKAQVSLCSQSTLFVSREGGRFWDQLQPPNQYEIEYALLVDGVPDPRRTARTIGIVEPNDATFLKAVFSPLLEAGALYRVTVRETGKPQPVAVGELSTKAKGVIKLSGAEAAEAHYRFEVFTATPLARVANDLLTLVEVLQKSQIGVDGVPVPERIKLHKVDVVSQVSDSPDCGAPPVTGADPAFLAGGLVVDLRPDARLSSDSDALRLQGMRDIFGQEVGAEGDIVPAKVPKGKDDAFAFAKLLFESAKGAGSTDTFALDMKLQPQFQMTGRWLFRPELNASVSKNVPGATDSVRLAALFSRTTVRQPGPLISRTFSLGPALEADREFDRMNVIVDLRWQPGLRGFYKSREVQRVALAARMEKKLEEVVLPPRGYGLELWIGAELGGSTSRQTVESSDEAQQLELDTYDIARLRPNVSAFYELGLPLDWQLTLNISSSLRYLFTEELTAIERPDKSLALRKVEGFEPFTEYTLSLAFDPQQHVSLAATYEDGAEPPVFTEVEKYSLGIVLKY